jgi:hypothetical protein
MARVPGPLARWALLILLSCSGCASWRERQEAANYSGLTANPYDNGSSPGLVQTLSNASVSDWNFRGMFR